MTPLTIDRLRAALDDKEIFALLGAELERRLPNGRTADDSFVSAIRALPRGLRAMAATYELDVSVTLDDPGWHFGNWHHLELGEETLSGLQELGADDWACIFAAAFDLVKRYWQELGSDNWPKWYNESPLKESLGPLNDEAWSLLNEPRRGILEHWVPYVRRFPERVV